MQTWCQTQSLVCPLPPPRLRPGLRAFRCASPSIGDLASNLSPVVLQIPCFNVVAGGSHTGTAFREYFIIPVGAETFTQAMRIAAECYHTLKGIIE